MILGIKVGPQKESIQDLDRSGAPFAEVWYNHDRAIEYEPLFEAMKQRRIVSGLHYWGVLDDATWTNISYPDSTLITQSMKKMKQTIDVAARHNCVYVNIHPGMRCIVKLDLTRWTYEKRTEPVAMQIAESVCMTNAMELHEYAKKRGVILTVETVPNRVANESNSNPIQSRYHPVDLYEMPIDTIQKLAQHGIAIANDLGHTASNCISDNRENVSNFLLDKTRQLMPYTKLLHIGYIIEPYSGVDYHADMYDPIMQTTQAIPNTNELKTILKLCNEKHTIYALVEPHHDHVGNYQYIQKLLREIDQ